jgi:hypothetical protein
MWGWPLLVRELRISSEKAHFSAIFCTPVRRMMGLSDASSRSGFKNSSHVGSWSGFFFIIDYFLVLIS